MYASNRLGIPLAVLSVREGKPSPTGRFTFTSWRLWNKDDLHVDRASTETR